MLLIESRHENAFDEFSLDVVVSLGRMVSTARAIEGCVQSRIHERQKLILRHQHQLSDQSLAVQRVQAAISEVAHAIRNPLHALRSSFPLLRQALDTTDVEFKDERIRNHLAREVQCDEIDKRVTALRQLGESLKLETLPLCLADEVRQWQQALVEHCNSRDAELFFEFGDNSVICKLHTEQLRQVVEILIDNALDEFAERAAQLSEVQRQREQLGLPVEADDVEPPRRICVRVSSTSPTPQFRLARLSVSDSGRGISDENLPKVFDAFFSTKRGPHEGYGLFMAQKIALAHTGIIRAQGHSALGGAEFIVEIPAVVPDASQ